jgi:hypothetical protein
LEGESASALPVELPSSFPGQFLVTHFATSNAFFLKYHSNPAAWAQPCLRVKEKRSNGINIRNDHIHSAA